MSDIILRVPRLSFLDMNRILVFARAGRADREGPTPRVIACAFPQRSWLLLLARSDDRRVDAPVGVVRHQVAGRARRHLSNRLHGVVHAPRFCDQLRVSARKRARYRGHPEWMAKLDTIIHELYHIDPHQPGIRRIERADGTPSTKCHSPVFFQDVVEMVTQYLTSGPDPRDPGVPSLRFRGPDRAVWWRRGDDVQGIVISPPVRRGHAPATGGAGHDCPVEPLDLPRAMTHFTENDLVVRRFRADAAPSLARKSKVRAA